ncbi:hypothetical protein MCHI_000175 [Candidatus Magnetoovum chiemensis]|nr:hypothetical protein MCHI_000175 [Candidatus Magnetoovum chiemensis]
MKSINICTDPFLSQYLSERGIDALVFDLITTQDQTNKILETLARFGSDWFLDKDGQDYTEYKNVSIGAAIYDEVLLFNHLLLRFIYLLDKLLQEYDNITFYQSVSCRMPKHILTLLISHNVTVNTIEYKYPYLCFQENFNKVAKSSRSTIIFNFESASNASPTRLFDLGLFGKLLISKILHKLFNHKKKFIIFGMNRSLKGFYMRYIKQQPLYFGLYSLNITKYLRKKRVIGNIMELILLSKKGILFYSLKCPAYYKWYVPYDNTKVCRELKKRFREQFLQNNRLDLDVNNKELLNFFYHWFEAFYLNYLGKFIKLIDFYYDKFSSPLITETLQEFIHPLQAQVMANLGKTSNLYPVNFAFHNQYFAPELFTKTKGYFKVCAVSDYDSKRYAKIGFHENDIKIIDSAYFSNYRDKLKPFKVIDSLKDKKVLILPNVIDCLNAFRHLITSKFLVNFFPDLFSILDEFKISSVIIRQHPGFIKQEGELYRQIIYSNKCNNVTFKVDFSNNEDIEDDILQSDIVIATTTSSFLQVLVLGRDFVYFEDSIFPTEALKDDFILLHEDFVRKIKTKEELKEHFLNYKPVDRELLGEKYYSNIFQNKISSSNNRFFNFI